MLSFRLDDEATMGLTLATIESRRSDMTVLESGPETSVDARRRRFSFISFSVDSRVRDGDRAELPTPPSVDMSSPPDELSVWRFRLRCALETSLRTWMSTVCNRSRWRCERYLNCDRTSTSASTARKTGTLASAPYVPDIDALRASLPSTSDEIDGARP